MITAVAAKAESAYAELRATATTAMASTMEPSSLVAPATDWMMGIAAHSTAPTRQATTRNSPKSSTRG